MKIFSFLGSLLSLLLSFQIAFASATPSYSYASKNKFPLYILRIDSNYNYTEPYLPSQSSLKIQDLKTLSETSTGYEDFVSKLATKAPSFFENPVLIHSSNSIQASSFLRPRMILFGNGLFMSFAEPTSTTKRSVEILNYQFETQTYSAAEITFDKSEIRFQENPKVCTTCHGTSLQPLWLPYDLWPQAYASFAGSIETASEKDHYTHFLKNSSAVGAYKAARLHRETYQPPFDNNYTQNVSSDTMTQQISTLQNYGLYTQMKASKEKIQAFRYAIIGALKECGDISKFLPQNINTPQPLSYYLSENKKDRDLRRSYVLDLFRRIHHTDERFFHEGTESRLDNELSHIANIRFLLENMGLNFQKHQVSNGVSLYGNSTPSHIAMDLATASVKAFPEVFHELKPKLMPVIGVEPGYAWADFNCDQLRQRSLEELSKLPQTQLPLLAEPSQENSRPVMGRCIYCHVTNRGQFDKAERKIPFIPFDQQQAFNQWLNTDQNYAKIIEKISTGKMPIGSKLSESEKASFMEALERFRNMKF